MERKMSRHWPGFRALCIVLLLSLENGTFGAINPQNLQTIVNYIREFGIEYQYAVAVRLDKMICQNPTRASLEAALPESVMDAMYKTIYRANGIYVPYPIQNVVAARRNALADEHAEWRLLHGGQNSPVAQMLDQNINNNCLIFFTQTSPCPLRCLNQSDPRNIVQWLNPLFNQIDQDSRAFVFQDIFEKEYDYIPAAWPTIKHAPLFRCIVGEEKCIQCFDNNDRIDEDCLVENDP